MDVNILRLLSRKDIQKLAQREEIKANSKTETIITELVAKYPDGVPRLMARAPKKGLKSETVEEKTTVQEELEHKGDGDKNDSGEAVRQDMADLGKKNVENNEAEQSISVTVIADSTTMLATGSNTITEPTITCDGGKALNGEATSSSKEEDVAKDTVSDGDTATALAEQQGSPPEPSEAVVKDAAPENKTISALKAAAGSSPVRETPAQVAARHAATGKRFIPISPLALTSVVASDLVVPKAASENEGASSSNNAAESDPIENTAAEIAARRAAKGKGRALPSSPQATSRVVPTAAQFMPQINPDWWKKTKPTQTQVKQAEVKTAANTASDDTASVTESPTQVLDPGYLIDQYLQDVAHMGSEGLVKKALRMARGQPTPIKKIVSAAYKDAARRSSTTGLSTPTPRSKPATAAVAAVAAALAAESSNQEDIGLPTGGANATDSELNSPRSIRSSLVSRASSNGTDRENESVSPAPATVPIRGVTKQRANQILRCIEAMTNEVADVRRSVQDLKVINDIAKKRTEKSMIAIEKMRALRVVITEHYVQKLRDDERLYNGGHTWVPAKEGEPGRDFSYNKNVSDEASSSAIVASSDSAGGASDPIAEGASGESGEADQGSPEAGSSQMVGLDGGDTEPEDEGEDNIPQNDGGDTEPEDEGEENIPQNDGGDTEPEDEGEDGIPQNDGGDTEPEED